MIHAAQIARLPFALALLLLWSGAVRAQRVRGELSLDVRDAQGAAVAATAELQSDATQFRQVFQVPASGRFVIQDLAFGVYRITVRAPGFAPWSDLVTIHSEIPVHLSLRLGVASVHTRVRVSDAATLVDPYRPATAYSAGRQALGETIVPQPGRGVTDLVDTMPGWLYEANGILHPRGSEYDVQYVIDGVPVTENRSPAFAPALDSGGIESVRVLTAGYPAEYGRKLGGIIEEDTEKNLPRGLHGTLDTSGGSFATGEGSLTLSYARAKDRFLFTGTGFTTGRYLDPPVLANDTNRATSGGFSASYERDFSQRSRLRVSFSRDETHFLIPNELVQQAAGQRQAASNLETSGEIHYQRILSPNLLWSAAGSVREAEAALSSNALSTPVIVAQDRGYREGYARTDVAGHHGRHDWKIGADVIFNPVHERLNYSITDPGQFDPGTLQNFQFAGNRRDVEPSAYVQDQMRLGNWNVSAGVRFDHYSFVVHESAWSARLAASRYIAALKLVVHASYDRVFQTPALENLLLASSPQLDSLSPIVVRLPVEPARGNYYEVGFTKGAFGNLRITGAVFRRDFRNYSDDDVLLDTGVSFPIAFAKAWITGEELRLEVPHWGRVSGYLSYSNQVGTGEGPITGGLFLGSDAGDLGDATRFAVSQDQRNTARARIRFQASARVWLAFGGEYGSGLPAETDGADPAFLLAQYGPRILAGVNLERGRVRPNSSLDLAGGLDLYRKEYRAVAVEVEAANLANRVNVINFASLFSGSAAGAPRSVSARLHLSF